MSRCSRARRGTLIVGALIVACMRVARADEAGDARAPPAEESQPPADDAVGEPGVAELQRAAIRHAGLEPERVRSWQRRLRLAALAPQLRVQVGRGLGDLHATTDSNGTTRLSVNSTDAWNFVVGATWSLDKLVFNPEELRLAREAQRVASRRERLVADVASIYYARRRLQATLARLPSGGEREAAEARLQLEELSAVLDGITGGTLRRGPTAIDEGREPAGGPLE